MPKFEMYILSQKPLRKCGPILYQHFFTQFRDHLFKSQETLKKKICLFGGKMLLLIHLHFNHVNLHTDEDGTFISDFTKYELTQRS